jgi:hypothetical protein
MPLAKERSSGWSSASTRVSQSSRASRPWTAGHHLGEAADVPAQGVQVRAAGLNGGEPCLVTGVKAVRAGQQQSVCRYERRSIPWPRQRALAIPVWNQSADLRRL